MRVAWLAVVVACGSSPPPRPIQNVTPAPAFSCTAAAEVTLQGDRSVTGPQHDRAQAELEAACKQDRWPEEYLRCKSAADPHCVDTRTEPQKKREHRILGLATLPAACSQYVHAIEAMAACAKLGYPRESVEQMSDAIVDTYSSWGAPERRQGIDLTAQCQGGVGAIQQALRQAGC